MIKDVDADVQYVKKIHGIHNDGPFLPEKIKNEKAERHLAKLHDKK